LFDAREEEDSLALEEFQHDVALAERWEREGKIRIKKRIKNPKPERILWILFYLSVSPDVLRN